MTLVLAAIITYLAIGILMLNVRIKYLEKRLKNFSETVSKSVLSRIEIKYKVGFVLLWPFMF